jgi:hypothetical protein
VQLLPFLEFVATSDRAGGMDDALILRDSMALGDWLRVFVPGPTQQQFIPFVYTGFVVCVLAVIGVTTARRSNATRAWLALLALSIAISIGPELLTRLPLTLFRYPARLVPIAALAIAALAAAGWERVRPNRRWLDLLLVLVIVADLLPRAMPLLKTAELRRDAVPYAREIGARAKVLRFGEVEPARRSAWMSGYLNLYDRRFDAFTAAPLASERYLRMHRELLARPTFEKFANAGIVYIITKYDLPAPWTAVASVDGVWVFENKQAFPMAAHLSPGSRALRHASWTLDTSSVRVTVNAPHDGILVLRQQSARGWKVTVDGTPAQALIVDGLFRGVNVPKGRHEVVWMYDPPLFFAGCVMTIVTLLAMQISLFVKRSR